MRGPDRHRGEAVGTAIDGEKKPTLSRESGHSSHVDVFDEARCHHIRTGAYEGLPRLTTCGLRALIGRVSELSLRAHPWFHRSLL